ncbi:MAG: flagellin [Ruminococcus sp.]|jgi:flagellin|nr:flagellin [Ruminococcus sp.]
MTLRNNISAMSAIRYMGMTNNSIAQIMLRLSSGYKINKAGDNPAGLAVSEKMRSQISGMTQAVQNAEDGMSMVRTFEGALNETHAILNRMKTIATQSANGIYDDETDRAALQIEYEELCKELDDIAETDFNGMTIFDKGASGMSYSDSMKLQVGARTKDLKTFDLTYDTAWQYLDDPDASRKKSIGELEADSDTTAAGLGLAPSAEVNISTQETANSTLDMIDNAVNKVSLVRAKLGSIENRLGHKVDNLNVNIENLTEAESRIRDTDVAAESLELAKLQILAQAQQSVLAMILQNQSSVLSLINSLQG